MSTQNVVPGEILINPDGARGQAKCFDVHTVEVARERKYVEFLINAVQILGLKFIIHYHNYLETEPVLPDKGMLFDVGEPFENS